MFDYLQKFNTLPANLRESVSSPAAMAVISDLENKYKIDLAAVVMKVMAKIIPLADLSIYFVSDFSLSQDDAKKLTAELKERLFFSVANYLGFNASYSSIVPKTAATPTHIMTVDKLIKDTGVTFAGVELNARFKNILATYVKGVRSRIDTRLTLSKEIASGGLGLDHKIVDKIFKLSDELIASKALPSGELVNLPLNQEPSRNGLDKVRALYEKSGEARDIPYDLKKAISTGAIKKPVTPLNLPIPAESKEKLLDEPEEELRIAAPVIIKSIEPVKPVKIVEVKSIEPVKPVLTSIVTKPKEVVKEPVKEVVSKPINIPVVPAPKPIIPVSPVAITANVAAAVTPVVAAATVKVASTLTPTLTPPVAPTPKINRPPEKKPSFFSKLFHKDAPKKVEPEIKKPVVAPVVTPPISVASLRTEAASISKPVEKAAPVIAKPVVEIKSVPKVMGPIEELKYLDLVNFRRLGSSPIEAAEKVESKIRLLEKDGYDKMVSGVLAWRDGVINAVYLKMGQESLTKGIPLKQCADNYRLAKNAEFLSWEEIEAIIALNTRLMF